MYYSIWEPYLNFAVYKVTCSVVRCICCAPDHIGYILYNIIMVHYFSLDLNDVMCNTIPGIVFLACIFAIIISKTGM